MSKALMLDSKFKQTGEIALPESFSDINSHNLYLYVKSYQAALRANTAVTKTRSDVRGGGRKPFAQKGGGRARAGSTRSPIFVGGGVAHGPQNNRNYNLKVNKKQKKLALQLVLEKQANRESLFVVDALSVESGKTKDAEALLKKLKIRDVLIVKELIDEKTFLAFRNLSNVYMIEESELNAYLVSVFHAVIIEKNVLASITRED